MINGTLFYTISTEIGIWDVFAGIRCVHTRNKLYPIGLSINMLKGQCSYVKDCVFEIDFKDKSILKPPLNILYSEKLTFECLDLIDNEFRKCLYYQVTTQYISFILSYCIRRTLDQTVILVRISNIEILNDISEILNLINCSEENKVVDSKNSKQTNTNNYNSNQCDINDENYNNEGINVHNTLNKSKAHNDNANSNKKTYNEKKIIELVKEILSFERALLIKTIKAMTKIRYNKCVIRDSKVTQAPFKELALKIANVKHIVEAANNNGGFKQDMKSQDKPYVLVEAETNNKNNPYEINNTYILTDGILKQETIIKVKEFEMDNFQARFTHQCKSGMLKQSYHYLIKKIDSKLTFIELTLTCEGNNVTNVLKQGRVYDVKDVLITIENHLKNDLI